MKNIDTIKDTNIVINILKLNDSPNNIATIKNNTSCINIIGIIDKTWYFSNEIK